LDRNSDDALMSQVSDGDVEKLGILFERHHVRLFNYLFRLTGDRGVAEDLVQEVFVRMLKYRASFRARGEFNAWMYALARNVSADWFGRRQKREMTTDEELAEHPSQEPLPIEQLESAESIERLRAALLQLPEDKRELLLLSRASGLSYDQIGALVGCNAGTVRVRVHRALRRLQQVFQAPGREASHGT
jgi:RNA polymerase sigma-70 factor (ECF subfamily)